VTLYLLELYVPRGLGLDEATARAQQVADADVRYVRTMLVTEDETCFHVFEASSREALRAAAEKCGLTTVRISEAVESAGETG
jgi:uncharacterized protein DUF4242